MHYCSTATLKEQHSAMTNYAIVAMQEFNSTNAAQDVLRNVHLMLSAHLTELAQDMIIEALILKAVALRLLGRESDALKELEHSWRRARDHPYTKMFSIWAGAYSRFCTCPVFERELDNKAKLQGRIQRLRITLQDEIVEVPRSFILPGQLQAFKDAAAASYPRLWLLKPHALSYGAGMRVLRSPSELPQALPGWHVQEYLQDTLTVMGFKFDLRVYVIVASSSPIILYVYNEGLVRIASKPYSLAPDKLLDRSIHLTALYPKPPEARQLRTVAQLLARLHHEGVNTTGLWERVTASVVRVVQLVLQDVVSQLSQESASSPCYKVAIQA